ncbi:hypothetical protein [Enterococcus dispar]|uniref:hypothetical protein n=1 Tax=Enterococcus dispar TaxID=44009 RepID=UPI0018A0E258|nr:hypothetical protein [Enterococcus dispar]
MLDIQGSLKNLAWTIEYHFLNIKNQHEFMRAWAVQFELAYTDFRVTQMALQLAGNQMDLLKDFTAQYDAVYQYEMAFASNGLAEFNEKFGDQLPQYEQAQQTLRKTIDQIMSLQPDDPNNLI